MLGAFLIMVPCIYYSERKRKVKAVFLGSISAIGVSQMLLFFFNAHWSVFIALLLIYFVAFNILEASLPSLVSKRADAHTRGTAMGIYSTFQFLGIFIGGVLAGFIYQFLTLPSIFVLNAFFAMIWAWIMLPLRIEQ